MSRLLIALIGVYQRYISRMLPPQCRFYPTCSTYTQQSLERFGLLRGLLLSASRILRCNPLFPGGYDPVPELRIPDDSSS